MSKRFPNIAQSMLRFSLLSSLSFCVTSLSSFVLPNCFYGHFLCHKLFYGHRTQTIKVLCIVIDPFGARVYPKHATMIILTIENPLTMHFFTGDKNHREFVEIY